MALRESVYALAKGGRFVWYAARYYLDRDLRLLKRGEGPKVIFEKRGLG